MNLNECLFSYVAHLIENPAVGTALHFGEGQVPQVLDQDQVNFLIIKSKSNIRQLVTQ